MAPYPLHHITTMITRDDVVSAYRLMLEREPENEQAIASWVERCDSTYDLVMGVSGSEEFRGRAPHRRISGESSTNLSPRAVAWLRDLDGIEGWLSPTAALMSAALAQYQAGKGYRGHIAEIGVYHGKYLTGLATAVQTGESAIAIDVFDEQAKNLDLKGYDEVGSSAIHSLTERSFLENARKYCPDAPVRIIKRSSLDVKPADILEMGRVRFFSIDGGHTRDVLLNDLALAEATLTPEGIISIDDILNPQWPGIITGAVRFMDGPTKLRPVAFITNKLLCAFEPFAKEYRDVLLDIAPKALQRRDVEFSDHTADQYVEA
ncbi:class I SAM-dependent methyltransferase [Burkholderia sp. JPY481]